MPRFLLTNMMAIFRANESTKKIDGFRVSSSENVDVVKWLSSQRDYDGFVLRPLLVVETRAENNIARPEFNDGKTYVSYSKAHYEVEITASNIDQYSLCDALYAAMALNEEPFDSHLALIPIPDECIPADRTISTKLATELYDKSFDSLPEESLKEYFFRSRHGYTFDFDDRVWLFVSTIVSDDRFVYASMFLREALRDYVFIGGAVKQVLTATSLRPASIAIAVRIENSIHNCYKAIEAISGGNLPQDRKKILSKFLKLGVDLEVEVGYQTNSIEREPAIDKLLRLRHSRDWKAAHGRIQKDRKITFYELMDFQKLTTFILIDAIQERGRIQ